MAKETVTVSVKPEEEQNTIDVYAAFGWEVVTSQEIYNKDSHLERKNDELVSVTETTNFVRIVFSREKNIPYYSRLCELQSNYNYYCNVPAPSYKKFIIACLIIAVLGVYFIIDKPFNLAILAGVAAIVVDVGLLILMIIIGSKKTKKYNYATQEKSKILEEAYRLTNSY